jgi:hypothetical protein
MEFGLLNDPNNPQMALFDYTIGPLYLRNHTVFKQIPASAPKNIDRR